MSALDCAAKLLREAGKPMNCPDLVKKMLAKKMWSTNGKTPAATLYAAMTREISAKGKASRFRKTDPGEFAFNTSMK